MICQDGAVRSKWIEITEDKCDQRGHHASPPNGRFDEREIIRKKRIAGYDGVVRPTGKFIPVERRNDPSDRFIGTYWETQ